MGEVALLRRLRAPRSLPPHPVGHFSTGLLVVACAALAAVGCAVQPGLVAPVHVTSVLVFSAVLVLGPLRTRRLRGVWGSFAAGALLLAVPEAVLLTTWDGSRTGILQALSSHGVLAVTALAGYVGLYAGQMLTLRQRVDELLPSAWFDGVHTTIVLAAVCSAWVVAPVRAATGLDALGAVALVGRPTTDLLLFSVALAMCSILGWRAERAVTLVAAAFGVLLLSDVVSVLWVCDVVTGYGWGLAVLLAHLAVLGLLAAAATSGGRRSSGRVQVAWSSMASPLSMLLLSGVLLGADHLHRLPAPTTALALTGLGAVGVKVCMVFREVLRLADSHDQARTDELTQLPNRRAFNTALAAAVGPGTATGRRRKDRRRRDRHFAAVPGERACAAVFLLDLDRFKDVNDTRGHAEGDALLQEVAVRVAAVLPAGAVLARLGGDEFAALLPRAGLEEAEAVARAVVERLRRPLVLRSGTLTVQVSIGVAGWPLVGSRGSASDGQPPVVVPPSGGVPRELRDEDPGDRPVRDADAEELLRRADTAMYVAKRAGGGIARYDAAADEHARAERRMAQDLAVGIGAGELVNHYQPQVDVRTGRVTGMEALVRWQHPVHGLLSPAVFLDLAEVEGVMSTLTATVLSQAAHDAVTWHEAG